MSDKIEVGDINKSKAIAIGDSNSKYRMRQFILDA
jgi:hypothetical protein